MHGLFRRRSPMPAVLLWYPHLGAEREAQSWSRKSAQDDKWSFCLTAGTLCPANQETR
jgi:hypothetical protein